jgi:hypothetical protein
VLIFAYSANKAWPLVMADLQWFIDHGRGKKMYMDEVSTFFFLLHYLRTQTVALFRTVGRLSHLMVLNLIAQMLSQTSQTSMYV